MSEFIFEREQSLLYYANALYIKIKFYLEVKSGEVQTPGCCQSSGIFHIRLNKFEYHETPLVIIEDPIKNMENYQGYLWI